MTPARRFGSIGFVLAALHGARAEAADDPEAEALVSHGVDLREQGKDEEALAAFKSALARAPTPRTRAQVALAEQALGMWVVAEVDLLDALAAGADPWIAKHRSALEGALAIIRRHLGNLEVRGTEGAEVFLDGVKLGTLPQTDPYRVEAGPRSLELRAPRHYHGARTIEVPAGGVARETVVLVRMPDETKTTTEHAGAPTSAGGRGSTARDGSVQRGIGWGLVGTGGAFLAAGGVALLVRGSYVAEYNDDASCPGEGSSAPQPPHCAERIDSERTWETVSIVSFVAGGVLAIGGLALLLTAPSAKTVALPSHRRGAWRAGRGAAFAAGGASFRLPF